MKLKFVAALLAGSAIAYSAPALAQEPLRKRSRSRPSPITSDATADAAIAQAAPVDDAQAKIELLEAQVEALQESLEAMKTPDDQGHPFVEGRAAVGGQGRRLVVQAARPASSGTPATSATRTTTPTAR